MSPGWVGCQPSSSRVSAFEAGLSAARKPASQVKCSAASSGAMATTGTSRCRPITSAMSRIGTPSSATPCSVDPAGRLLQRQAEEIARHRGGAPRASGWTRRRCSRRRPWSRAMSTSGRDEAVVSVAVHRRGESHDSTSARRAKRGRASVCAVASRFWRTADQRRPHPSRARARRVLVASRPGASPSIPEAMTNGRSEPASASPNVSTARRSASAAPGSPPRTRCRA